MKKSFLTVIMTIASAFAWAVPAFPDMVRFQQPGKDITVSIFLKGDERVHWAETEDGYSLMYGDDGALMYAMLDKNGDMVTSEYLATDIAERSKEVDLFLKKTPRHLRYSQSQVDEMLKIWDMVEKAKSGPKAMTNVTGNKKFLVILFGFSDRGFYFGKQVFKMMFNQVNYSANGATGSVHDYYYDVSGGLFSLQVDVVGPFIGVHELAHYGNSDNGYQDFAHEAVDSAAKHVNFADYDNDGDGYIDGLHIIFAGHGEEAGAGEDCIWSHKWNIFNPPTYNNTVIDVYSCSPEMSDANGQSITKIGVICHELGHVFGAPDYYDTDYAGSGGEYPGLGQWDIMSSGSWNRGGKSPAHHNPYTKAYIYHWIDIDTINNTTGTVVMNAASSSTPDFHRVNTSTEGDFFLLENRQKVKWDQGIPSHGLLVYHIHPDAQGAWVSNSRHPQQIYIMAQTNPSDTFPNSNPSSYGLLNSSNATYSSENNRDSLTDNSVPWFRPWSKAANNCPITNVSERDNLIFFTMHHSQPEPLDATATGLSNSVIEVNWTRYGSRNTMVVMNDAAAQFGIPQGTYHAGDTIDGGGIVVYSGNGSNILVQNLERNHTYYFKVFSIKRNTIYSDGIVMQASTLDCDGGNWTSEDFESLDNGSLPPCWNGSWTVDSIDGQKALVSSHDNQAAQRYWVSVTAQPITLDATQHGVVSFRLALRGNASQNTQFKAEFKSSPTAEWQVVYTDSWRWAMPDWVQVNIPLREVGNYSLLRFSVLSDGSDFAAIDAIDYKSGFLLHSWCDDNTMITPLGDLVAENNESITYTISPLSGYQIKSLTVDEVAVDTSLYTIDENGMATFTISNIDDHHTIYATSEKKAAIDNAKPLSVNIYPNPTSGLLTIDGAQGNIELYDITGRLLLSSHSDGGRTELDLSRLNKGIYILNANGKANKVVKK